MIGKPKLAMNDNDCTYTFEWETTAACSNEDEEVECSVHDAANGKTYDLSPLTKTSGNWEVRMVSFKRRVCVWGAQAQTNALGWRWCVKQY